MDWLIILGKEKQLDIFQVPVPEKQILSIIYNFLNQIQSSSDFRTIAMHNLHVEQAYCNTQYILNRSIAIHDVHWTGLMQYM